MSEFAPQSNEKSGFESLAELKIESQHELPTAQEASPLQPGEKDPLQVAQEARQEIATEIEQQPNPAERFQAAQEAAEPVQAYASVPDKELRGNAAKQGLRRVQRQESTSERNFSKLIHQPVVRAVSENAAKTVSRPSGLLGGGIVALLGTTGYLYLAKHLGFTYNYFVFLLLFVVGFLIGLAIELVIHVTATSRRTE